MCPRLKACVETDSSKNTKNRERIAKVGTLSLAPSVTGAPIIKFLSLAQEIDKILLPKKISRRHVKKI